MTSFSGIAGDPDEVQARIDQWAQGFAAKAERYRAAQQQTEQLRLTASSSNGAVRVTVGADGNVTALEFGNKARTIPLEELSAQILDTMRRAQAGIAERVGEVMAGQLGDEDPETRTVMLDNLRSRFPDPEADEDEEPQAPPRRQEDRAQNDGDEDSSPW